MNRIFQRQNEERQTRRRIRNRIHRLKPQGNRTTFFRSQSQNGFVQDNEVEQATANEVHTETGNQSISSNRVTAQEEQSSFISEEMHSSSVSMSSNDHQNLPNNEN